MNKRVTLTIDLAVLRQAKQLAKSRGISVSVLVEGLLANEAGLDQTNPIQPKKQFSEKWAGKFQLDKKSSVRSKRLAKKYKLYD